MDVINIIASVASIVGAVIAIWQAMSAKSAAEIAVDAKKEVLNKKTAIEFHSLLSKAKEIEKILIAKSRSNLTQQRGRNDNKDHTEIESFISMINEKKSIALSDNANVFLTEKYNQLVEFNHREEKPITDMLACVREIIAKLSEDINRSTYK